MYFVGQAKHADCTDSQKLLLNLGDRWKIFVRRGDVPYE